MSKYYDRLVKINESLDKALKSESIVSGRNNFEVAIEKYGSSEMSDADALIMAFNREMMNNPKYSTKSIDDVSLAEFCGWLVDSPSNSMWDKESIENESTDDNTVPVPTDSLTDDQKKEILVNDKNIDKKVVDGMSPEEMDGALKATDDEVKKESSDSKFVIKMNDPDLDMVGYVEVKFDPSMKEVKLTDEIGGAALYDNFDDAMSEIDDICKTCKYDKDTFDVVEGDSNTVNIDDGETWISLDPMHPGATTLP